MCPDKNRVLHQTQWIDNILDLLTAGLNKWWCYIQKEVLQQLNQNLIIYEASGSQSGVLGHFRRVSRIIRSPLVFVHSEIVNFANVK